MIVAEGDLFTGLHGKISKLSTQKLSPNLLPAPELVKILKSIKVELPPQLMLPRDPRETPWYYYNILKTSTIALTNRLVVTIEIPLLDVAQKFHVKEAINLTAEYELEFSNFAISGDGRQYVILTLEDQLNCAKPNINFCAMTSAVYEMNHHRYCTLALYQIDILKVNELCKTHVTNKLKLPLARYISQGQWLVATNKPFYLRKLCVKSTLEELITVSPPFIVVSLDSGCRALADKLELPIYFEERSEYKVERETRITTPIRCNLTDLPIWTPLVKHHVDVNFDLEKLPPIDSKPIDEFIQMLEETKNKGKFKFYPSSAPYIAIALVVFILLMVVVIVCMKRQFIMGLLTKTVLKNISSSKEVPHRKHSVTSSDSDKESDQVHQTVSGTAQTAQGARRKVIKTVASSAKSNVMYNGKDGSVSLNMPAIVMRETNPFDVNFPGARVPHRRPRTTLRLSH